MTHDDEVAAEYAAEMARALPGFDPGQHLTKIKGQEYLEVKWRIAWLRSEHPDAVMHTELHSHENGRAIFSARVEFMAADPETGVLSPAVATGWGSETVDSFENYVEKAETKALGRALAHAGFGTQIAVDLEDTGYIVDAPVGQGGQPQYQNNHSGGLGAGRPGSGHAQGDPMSQAAKDFFYGLCTKNNVRGEQVVAEIQRRYPGKSKLDDLTKREGTVLTNEWLKPLVGYVDNRPNTGRR